MRINMVMLPIDILLLKTTMEKHCGDEHNSEKGHVSVCVWGWTPHRKHSGLQANPIGI